MINPKAWSEFDAANMAAQRPDVAPLLDRLPANFIEGLNPLQVVALASSPAAYLRGRQIVPDDPDWMTAVFMTGRGWGKSKAAAAWIIDRVLEGSPARPADFALVAPTVDDCWRLQWRVIRDDLPPWVRYVERIARSEIVFPDHGVTLLLHSAEVSEYRGPNLRGAWCEEPIKWPHGEELWSNLNLAVRMPGTTPPRIVVTTTPPKQLDWILELCVQPTTRVIRGTMLCNPKLDERKVAAAYSAMRGTVAGKRELDGQVVLGVDGALFKAADLERHRIDAPPRLEQIVVAVDPAQSAKKDADPVGIVVVGIARGHLYVLASCSERLDPATWAGRAITWAALHNAGRYVVEPTGSGGYPKATLEAQMRIGGASRLPIVESKAKGSKADRAQPLSAACAQGRLHLVGVHRDLETELTTWYPGARFSPGGLDALVHGASELTYNWRQI